MRRTTALALVCMVVALRPIPAVAAFEAGSAEAIVEQALDAMNHDRIEEFAAAMHPEALKHFHAAMATIVDLAGKEGKAEQLLPLFGARSLDELKSLDDRTYFVRYMRGVTGVNPALKQALAQARTTVLGHVAEGKDTLHVVYLMKLGPDESGPGQPKVVSLRRDGSKWGMLLLGDVDAMLLMIKQKIAGNPQPPDLKASQIHALGHVLQGKEAVHVVYRITTPFGGATTSKVAAVAIQRNEPGWEVARKGHGPALVALIREKTGL